MIYSKAAHPNCMYLWMNYIISPDANAKVAEYFGEAPSNAKACEKTSDPNTCAELPRRRRGVLGQRLLLEHAAGRLRRRPRRRLQDLRGLAIGLDGGPGLVSNAALMSRIVDVEPPPRQGPGRRLSTFFIRHSRLRLAALLALPLGWLLVIYLGSLFLLLLASFWSIGGILGTEIAHTWNLDNYRTLLEEPVYRNVAFRTISMAALVTVADAVLALPIAYYMARVASSAPATSWSSRC